MTFLTIAIVVSLVFWALRLMDKALVSQEFSLMLAGFLVAAAAAAMVGVYFLMSDYMLYINHSGFVDMPQDLYAASYVTADGTAIEESGAEVSYWYPDATALEKARLAHLPKSVE